MSTTPNATIKRDSFQEQTFVVKQDAAAEAVNLPQSSSIDKSYSASSLAPAPAEAPAETESHGCFPCSPILQFFGSIFSSLWHAITSCFACIFCCTPSESDLGRAISFLDKWELLEDDLDNPLRTHEAWAAEYAALPDSVIFAVYDQLQDAYSQDLKIQGQEEVIDAIKARAQAALNETANRDVLHKLRLFTVAEKIRQYLPLVNDFLARWNNPEVIDINGVGYAALKNKWQKELSVLLEHEISNSIIEYFERAHQKELPPYEGNRNDAEAFDKYNKTIREICKEMMLNTVKDRVVLGSLQEWKNQNNL